MSVLAQRNARLVAIAPGSTRRQYGKDQAPGAARWTGEVGVAIVQREAEVVSGVRASQALHTHLVAPTSVEVEVGEALTYVYRGETVTRTARDVQRADAVGAVRVFFEEA